jgi:branched-chain amino acid transport system permease protein
MTGKLIRAYAPVVVIIGLSLIAMTFIDNYMLRLATIALMYAGLSLSWNLIGGYTGYPSFATSAFFGLGAYISGVAQHNGLPMIAAWLSGFVGCGVFAVLFGSAILRLRGHYFAVASLVIAEVLRELITTSTNLTGGGMGLNLPAFSNDPTVFGRAYFLAMLGLMSFGLALTIWIDRSKVGIALRCIRQNEDAAVVVGVNTTGYKVLAFSLSGSLAGVIGAVYGSWVSYIDPSDAFDILISVKPIIMTLLGGPGTVAGPVLGAFIFLLLEETVWRHFMTLHEGLLGLIVVGLILYLPSGISVTLPKSFLNKVMNVRLKSIGG